MNPNIENGYLKKGSERISDLNSVENPQHVWVFFFFLTESKFFVDTDFFQICIRLVIRCARSISD